MIAAPARVLLAVEAGGSKTQALLVGEVSDLNDPCRGAVALAHELLAKR